MGRLKIDLHPVRHDGRRIDASLQEAMDRAVRDRLRCVEIVHGRGTGQLKKRVLRFLQRPDIKARYHRVEKDVKNPGRVFVHFRHG